jgi:DNA mismatch repair protein MutH
MDYQKELKNIYDIGRSAIGKTIRMLSNNQITEDVKYKGQIGNIIQEHLYGIKPNSKPTADFEELDVELKVIPVMPIKNNLFKAKERLVLNMIDFNKVAKESFFGSSFLAKNKIMQILIYEHNPDCNKLDYKIVDAFMIDISKQEEWRIIENDWTIIKNIISSYQTHNLSESKTNFLAACTKGANSNSLTTQIGLDTPVKTRAFSFKTSFLNNILNRNKNNRIKYFNEIFEDAKVSDFIKPLEIKNIISYFKSLIGKDFSYLVNDLNGKSKYNQALNIFLKKDQPDIIKFAKSSNITILTKTTTNNIIKEEIGTNHNLNIYDILNEKFEDSTFYQEVVMRKFIVVCFDRDTNILCDIRSFEFDGIATENARTVFNITKVELEKLINSKYKGGYTPNFVKSKDNLTLHIRPHARNKLDYFVYQGETIPITKQQFWINKRELKSETTET